jgi:hypothetical protein
MPHPDHSCCAEIYEGKRRLAGGATWGIFTLPIGSACAGVRDDQSASWFMETLFYEPAPPEDCLSGNPGPRQNGEYNAFIKVCNPEGAWLRMRAEGVTEQNGLRWDVDVNLVWIDGFVELNGHAPASGILCTTANVIVCKLIHLDPGIHRLSIAQDTVDGWQNLDGMGWLLTLTLSCQVLSPDECEEDDGGGPEGPGIDEPVINDGGDDDQDDGLPGDPPGPPLPPGDPDGTCICECFVKYMIGRATGYPDTSCENAILVNVYNLSQLNDTNYIMPWDVEEEIFHVDFGTVGDDDDRGIQIGTSTSVGANPSVTTIYLWRVQASVNCQTDPTCSSGVSLHQAGLHFLVQFWTKPWDMPEEFGGTGMPGGGNAWHFSNSILNLVDDICGCSAMFELTGDTIVPTGCPDESPISGTLQILAGLGGEC